MAGRPPIGPRKSVRITTATADQITAWQTRWGLPGESGNAEAHRRILAAGLAALDQQGEAMTSIATMQLPNHVHVKRLEENFRGLDRARVIVWADRPNAYCPHTDCREPIAQVVPCPVDLSDDQVNPFRQQHGCGTWLRVNWTELPGDATEAQIVQEAKELADARTAEVARLRDARRASLSADLVAAIEAITVPLDDDETLDDRLDDHLVTGDDAGVSRDSDDPARLIAWAPDPAGDDEDGITVTSDRLDVLNASNRMGA